MGPTRQARLRGASTPWQPPPPQSVQVSARQRLSMAALPWASSSPWASRCSQQRQGQACMGSPPQGAEGQGEPPESLCFRTGTPIDRSRVPRLWCLARRRVEGQSPCTQIMVGLTRPGFLKMRALSCERLRQKKKKKIEVRKPCHAEISSLKERMKWWWWWWGYKY